MIDVRPFASLGHAQHGWLDARHHFSFGEYYDPQRMGWGKLRVWNDDAIAPQTGFPAHPHREMEIITYVRKGAISHKDSLGNNGRTEAGDVQVMSAGTGIQHAEVNAENEETQLFQIWIVPTRNGEAPSWGAKPFPKDDRSGKFMALASGFAEDMEAEGGGALPIRTDARVLGASVKAGQTVTYLLGAGRHAYLVPASGTVTVNGVTLATRDGAAIKDEETIEVTATTDAELVLVDAG